MRRLLMVAAAAFALASSARAGPEPPTAQPIVIGHRGASGYRPEHTAMSYRLAVAQGADYVEPDLVMTRDGVLVARHENEIGRTTDVADHPEFAGRRVTRTIDGETFTGWFVEDFTLAELKTLRARERRPEARKESAGHDGREPILTLQEIIDIVRDAGKTRPHPVGLYVELKNPDYFRSIGLPMEKALVQVLSASGLNTPDAPVIIQSFWPSSLVDLRKITPVRLMFLLNSQAPPESVMRANGIRVWSDVYSPEGLRRIAGFADIVGPETRLILPQDETGHALPPTTFVHDAHAAGLAVHVWSINAENEELPVERRRGDPKDPAYPNLLGDADGQAKALFAQGVDGAFTDQPDIVVGARTAFFGPRPK